PSAAWKWNRRRSTAVRSCGVSRLVGGIRVDPEAAGECQDTGGVDQGRRGEGNGGAASGTGPVAYEGMQQLQPGGMDALDAVARDRQRAEVIEVVRERGLQVRDVFNAQIRL